MLKCTVCLAENDDFSTTCIQCKAFLQDRVPNLNLFETSWQVIESPSKAFRKIALAEHKNYVLFLFSLLGVSLAFTAFWYFRLGTRFQSLLDLIPAAVGLGVILGLVSAFLVTVVYHLLAKSMGGMMAFRGSLGVLAYSMTPVAFSLVLILPIELLTFGMFLFTGNPDPYVMKPVSYVLLLGFDALIAVWTLSLAVAGTKVGHRLSILKSMIVVFVTLGLFGVGVVFAAFQLRLIDHV
jgi:hypothetical protein